MKENLEYIEDIFSSLKDSDAPLRSKPSWNTISPKVQKLNFFKPKFSSFNIVYASLIAGSFLASIYLVTDNISNKRNQKQIVSPENTPLIIYDTLNVNDTLRITDTLLIKTTKFKQKNVPKLIEINASDITPDSTNSELQEQANSPEKMTTQEQNDVNKTEALPLKIKKVTIVRKKKVIVRDTVIVNSNI